MQVTFAPIAIRDVEEIGDYINAENPGAARRLIAELRQRCADLADVPQGGRARSELSPGLRSVAFRRYVIFYSLGPEMIRIERVLHGARDLDAIFDIEAG